MNYYRFFFMFYLLIFSVNETFAQSLLRLSKSTLESGRVLKIFSSQIQGSASDYHVTFIGSKANITIVTTMTHDGFLEVFVPFIFDETKGFKSDKVKVSIVELGQMSADFFIKEPPALKDYQVGEYIQYSFSEMISTIDSNIDFINSLNVTNPIYVLQQQLLKQFLIETKESLKLNQPYTLSAASQTFTYTKIKDLEDFERVIASSMVGALEAAGYLILPRSLEVISKQMLQNGLFKLLADPFTFLYLANMTLALDSTIPNALLDKNDKQVQINNTTVGTSVTGAFLVAAVMFTKNKLEKAAEDRQNNAELKAIADAKEAYRRSPARLACIAAGNCVAPEDKNKASGICQTSTLLSQVVRLSEKLYIETTSSGAPIACMTISNTTGTSPLLVNFDTSCMTDPNNNIHRMSITVDGVALESCGRFSDYRYYNSSGSHTVSMTVFGTNGASNTITYNYNVTIAGTGDKRDKQNYFNEFVLKPFNDLINEVKTAVADFTYFPTTGNYAASVNFNAAVSSGPYILDYIWQFSDGSPTLYRCWPTLEKVFTHTTGITLTVVNKDGETATSAEKFVLIGNGD